MDGGIFFSWNRGKSILFLGGMRPNLGPTKRPNEGPGFIYWKVHFRLCIKFYCLFINTSDVCISLKVIYKFTRQRQLNDFNVHSLRDIHKRFFVTCQNNADFLIEKDIHVSAFCLYIIVFFIILILHIILKVI